MDVFPAIFPLEGATVVVAGEGEAADAKARLFAASPAILKRVSCAMAGREEAYIGARLAFVAIPGGAAVIAAAAARGAGALVNVVDRPELCDFTTPAIVDRGSVVAAIATGGVAPVLAAELRREIEALWPQGLGAVAELLAALRDEVRATLPDMAARRAWLRRLLDGSPAALAQAGRMAEALQAARADLAAPGRQGRLSLLAPPSSIDLLSLRALQALSRADRLVVAEGTDAALLALARRDAPVDPLALVTAEAIAAQTAAGAWIVGIGPREAFEAYGPAEHLPVAAPPA